MLGTHRRPQACGATRIAEERTKRLLMRVAPPSNPPSILYYCQSSLIVIVVTAFFVQYSQNCGCCECGVHVVLVLTAINFAAYVPCL